MDAGQIQIDATSDSTSAITAQRTDAVHSNGTDNGAVVTTTDRTVKGDTQTATDTDATVQTRATTAHIANGTLQTVNRDTTSHSESEATTAYVAQTSSSATNYDVHRVVRYLATVRTVVTDAAASTFAAGA